MALPYVESILLAPLQPTQCFDFSAKDQGEETVIPKIQWN